MGLIKKGTTAINEMITATTNTPANILIKAESGTAAAIERLQKKEPIAKGQAPKPEVAKASAPVYKQRDFDAEAKGKVRCVMFEAALQSPALAGLPFKSLEEFLEIVAKAADVGVNYTWR